LTNADVIKQCYRLSAFGRIMSVLKADRTRMVPRMAKGIRLISDFVYLTNADVIKQCESNHIPS